MPDRDRTAAHASGPRQLEGSLAIARAVARCRPGVVAAYPISPQTHIVEALSDMVRTGDLAPCEYLMVESEFGALSACIGASAAGARTYTATASQGLLFMAEAVFNASGLGLPIVMTVANRAIGAPINIWNDQSDSMSLRDSGWVQLYAASNQEAVDLHVQAFLLAETLSVPVMVCMDGFVLTHAVERIDVPAQEQVDAYLPAFEPQQSLDPTDPITIGAMVGPEAFTEVKYLMHVKQLQALDLLPTVMSRFSEVFGRTWNGPLRPYRTEGARTIVVSIGSALGTIEEVVDGLRDEGVPIGCLGITCFRPWPMEEVRSALQDCDRVVVVERAFAVGAGGIIGQDVRLALAGLPVTTYDVVAGLGGRPVTRRSLRSLLDEVLSGQVKPAALQFLDLKADVVHAELARSAAGRRGPHAEHIIEELGDEAVSLPSRAGRTTEARSLGAQSGSGRKV
jgi:pyruvate ferredoxin oxidoreductase alpha subunit